jgi:thiol-disulfide isomerase/thioredoxin
LIWNLAEFNDAQLHVMLVKFGAVWCKPCHAAKPLIEKWADTVNSLANVAMWEDVDVGSTFTTTLNQRRWFRVFPPFSVSREFVVYPDDSWSVRPKRK